MNHLPDFIIFLLLCAEKFCALPSKWALLPELPRKTEFNFVFTFKHLKFFLKKVCMCVCIKFYNSAPTYELKVFCLHCDDVRNLRLWILGSLLYCERSFICSNFFSSWKYQILYWNLRLVSFILLNYFCITFVIISHPFKKLLYNYRRLQLTK